MQERPFGGTGRQVPIIGQGTWNLEFAPRLQAVAALQRGLDLGLRHIDTAEMYGDGDAESLVGEAIAGRRDEVFLVSKVLPSNASTRGVRSACERSLKRLRTDRLDCYLLHWRGSYPLEETFAAFEDLQREGKILSFGVSNFDVDDLEEAIDVLGPGRVACNQVLYHLKERAIEHAVIPWCEANQIAVVAYSPFGQDAFPAPDSAGGRVLAAIADAHGATARQVALAFLTRSNDVFAIPKASSADHTQANAGAGDILLTDDEIVQIDKAFPRGAKPRGLPML
ncbi:aldo/keto reductase [Pigmentiphaga litoralis]|uniref:aldo/keto reductase n=1 Tax=Pigmentiphaga litoralis TaxID=516702 RepID=UPI003B42F9FA